jgi:CDP-paratose 2-epimerase
VGGLSSGLLPADVSVGVVIVNKDAGRHLGRVLESLERQTVGPRRVVIIDNASTDDSLDGLEERFPSVELVRSGENLGFAAANNLAVGMCSECELIALLNPDAFPEPSWLETLVAAAAAHPAYGFFGSRLVRDDDAGMLDGTGDMYHVSGMAWRRDQGAPATVEREAGETFSACAAAAVYRRDVFVGVGGFDETFFCYYEDTDLAFRLRLAGHRCLYVPEAVVRHVGSATSGLLSEFTIYHSTRNQVWTFVKNMPGPLLWLYLPQHLLVGLLTTLVYALHGQGLAALRGKRDALRALPRVLGERRRIQAARVASTGDVRSAMARGTPGYVHSFLTGSRVLRWFLLRLSTAHDRTRASTVAAAVSPQRGIVRGDLCADARPMASSRLDAGPATRRVLIAGGAGFVGANLAVALAGRHPGWDIVALDNLRRRGSELNLIRLREAGVTFVHGDVRALDDVLALDPVDAVVECSAEPSALAGVDGAPSYALHTNLLGAYHCLELARRDAAQFVFLSTSRVYPIGGLAALRYDERETRFELGGEQHGPGVSADGISEAFPLLGARTIYGTSKLAAELLVGEYAAGFGVPTVVNRCGVIAGPWQMGKVDQGVFTYWLLAHHLGLPLRYLGFAGSGKQVRDVLHVDDLVDLLDDQLARPEAWAGATVNVGGGREHSLSLRETTDLCRELTGNDVAVDSAGDDPRPGDVPIYISDCARLGTFSTWRPRRAVRQTLSDTYAWLLDHEAEVRLALAA